MSFLPLVRFWLWISVLASVAGWTLSALGQLNRSGYAVFFAVFAAVVFICRKEPGFVSGKNCSCWKKFLRRFRRPLPLCFAVLVVLVFLGGVLYPAGMHTAYTYHIPRVLHWLVHERWVWIYTPDTRMNVRAGGMEWMMTPLLLFTRSDRAVFLLNFIPFLLLPGMFFSFATRLGVRRQVAWYWMWLLPTGYNFLLQANSAGNDTFPVVYVLAAIDFGCRAWASRRVSDLWYSLLAIALLTGSKASNLTMMLPWVILVFALVPLLWRRPVGTGFMLAVAALVSFLPNAVLNKFYCGEWLGLNLEAHGIEMKNPIIGVLGNAFQLLSNNFVPTFFPLAGWWNHNAPLFMPHAIVKMAENYFDTGYFWLGEMPTEDWAGIGFGLSVLLSISVAAAFVNREKHRPMPRQTNAVPAWVCRCVLASFWISLLAYCAKSGMVTAARLISPYYPLLLSSLLVGAGHSKIVRQRWWQGLAFGVWLLALVVLVVEPGHPLWPEKTILSRLSAAHPNSAILARAETVYAVYAIRSDPLPQVRAMLPPDLRTIGFLGTPDDIAISFWRPYGTKRVEHILLDDTTEQIRQRGIQFAVVSGLNFKQNNATLETWLDEHDAELLATTNAIIKVSDGPQPWYVVRFKQ